MTSIIDRYVAATRDGFPGSDQAEVENEVRSALNDIAESHVAEGMTREQAERAAVNEVGEPGAFSEQFRKNERYLVGPRLFRFWWLIVRMILLIVVPLAMGATFIGVLAGTDGSIGHAVGDAIGSGFELSIQIIFWVTLIYAIIERVGVSPVMEGSLVPSSNWSADDLAEVETGRQIGNWDLVLQVIPVSLLAWFTSRIASDGLDAFGLNQLLDLPNGVAAFNPDLSVLWFWGLVSLVLLNVLLAVWSFMVGFWTSRVTVANVLVSIAWIVFFVALSAKGEIVNPEIQVLNPEVGDWSLVGPNANDIIVGIVVITSAWDIWESVRGHLAYRGQITSGIEDS